MPDLTPAEISRIGEWAGLFNGGRAAVRCDRVLDDPDRSEKSCPDCDGSGIHVLDEGLLRKAVRAFAVSRGSTSYEGMSDEYIGNRWKSRHTFGDGGKAMTAFVLDYAVDWEPTGDDVLAVLDTIGKSQAGAALVSCEEGGAYVSAGDHYVEADTLREAVLRAALAIAESEVG